MALSTELINIDITLPDGAEFSSATFVAELSGSSWDTVDNQAVPKISVTTSLDASGVGTISLWPPDRGTKDVYYTAKVRGTLTSGNIEREYVIGRFEPTDGNGPFDLNVLLEAGYTETIITPTLVERAEKAADEAETARDIAIANAAGTTTYASQGDLPAVTVSDNGTWAQVLHPAGLQAWLVVAGSWAFQTWLKGPSYDDADTFFAASDSFADDEIVTVDAEGFSYKALPTSATGSVANAAPQDFKVLTGGGDFNLLAFGAEEGGTDNATVLTKALDAADAEDAFVYVPPGTFQTSAISPSGAFRLRGPGTIHQTGDITIAAAAGTVEIDGVTFTKSADGLQLVHEAGGTPLTRVRVENTTVTGGGGYQFRSGADDVVFANNTMKDLASASGQLDGLRIGANDYADSVLSTKIRVYGNNIENVTNAAATETHGILVYGYDIAIYGNTISGVENSDNSGCEAIYTKGVCIAVTGNTVLNSGPQDDGCITVKGVDVGETSAPQGHECTVSGNTVSFFKNETEEVVGISVKCDNVTVGKNTIYNCRLEIEGNYQNASGNMIHIEADGYGAFGLDIGTCREGTFSGNEIFCNVTNYDAAQVYAARMGATGVIDGVQFSGNKITGVWDGLTNGSTSVAALYIDNSTFDFDAMISGNRFKPTAAGVGTFDVEGIYIEGGQDLTGAIMGNWCDQYYFMVDDGALAPLGTFSVEGNSHRSVPLGGSGRTLRSAWDAKVVNTPATANRTATLPDAQPEARAHFLADNDTYDLIVSRAGTDTFLGGATTKTLSPGSAMSIVCKTAGVWVIDREAGTIT